VEIDGEGAVLAFGFVGLWHVSSPFEWRWVEMRHREDNVLKDQADCERIGASPLNALECGNSYTIKLELELSREIKSYFSMS
jgi:hypothetical protein